ncbi:ATP-NAD kinase family protein [Catenovulum sp. SM1970]|uniref:ATP-NAD kinase family protein n=1 Tax=Marinifaba aquimaris TaxID=2741323 RepID=UPI0015733354|nr:ATP-NAD kinase family protein [Marinifaba aquimaris]NTS77973.1 ATP-NAD kinase family protein [Marinifaba aquimaris]
MKSRKFKLGLIINPVAGIGGSVALKGSDGEAIQQQAIALGATPKSHLRAELALAAIKPVSTQIEVITASGKMGEQSATELGFEHNVVYQANDPSTAEDTEMAVKAILAHGVDLILFAGGDGTARNIYSQIDENTPVLGIPAGCKIHSGVYALTPTAAGVLTKRLVEGEILTLAETEVMDIDESLFRGGQVKAKRYGEMQVPMDLRYVQAVKMGGKESEELVLADIAADIIERMDDETLFLIGSGSTTAHIMHELTLDNTLLGVDAILDQEPLANDLTSDKILSLLNNHNEHKLVITLIGGQGHLFGRGNQQLSPQVIRAIGKDNILVVATKSKLEKLNGRPLILDTGDPDLDAELSGPFKVITGFHDTVLYPAATI